MPLKYNNKRTPFYMSSNRSFLKDSIDGNNWLGKPAMKTVDDVAFKKRKETREGKNDKNDNFEMMIIDEGVLDKALEGPAFLRRKSPRRKIMRSLMINTSNNQMLSL